jgi:hypothetical protein
MKRQQAEIFIRAPIRRVYDFISDWRNTPRYERLVVKIEKVGDGTETEQQSLAHSHLKVLGLKLKSLYRYRFLPPTKYSGVQLDGLVRGGFWFKLTEMERGTRVLHGEFITSRWKWLERLTALLLWKVFFPADIQRQLRKLKKLIEGNDRATSPLRMERTLARLAGSSLLD